MCMIQDLFGCLSSELEFAEGFILANLQPQKGWYCKSKYFAVVDQSSMLVSDNEKLDHFGVEFLYSFGVALVWNWPECCLGACGNLFVVQRAPDVRWSLN